MLSFSRDTLYCLAVAFVMLACAFWASAQPAPPLSTGSLGAVTSYGACPGGFMGTPMTCWQTTVQGCTGTDPLGLIFGFAPAANSKGLVVFFNGEGGTSPDGVDSADEDFAQAYFNAGYSVVQTKWMANWEYAMNPNDPNPVQSVQLAACRPATFLWWARNNTTEAPVMFPAANSRAGMCAQGFSAGSGAIANALAFYNAGAPITQNGAALDKVIFNVGPEITDLKRGCVDPVSTTIPICNGQGYCLGWPTGGIQESLAFVQGTEKWIRKWTGDSSCQTGHYTQNSEDAWEDQSIINADPNDPQPNFSYPSTDISSYLCASVSIGTANNSSPQGWEFLNAVGSLTPAQPLVVNAVNGCVQAEGFIGTGATALWQGHQPLQQPTMNVVEADMTLGANGTAACTRSSGH